MPVMPGNAWPNPFDANRSDKCRGPDPRQHDAVKGPSRCKHPRDAKADIVFAGVWWRPVAACRSQRLGAVQPRTAANHPSNAIVLRPPRRSVDRGSLISIAMAILDPFRDVAVHVV